MPQSQRAEHALLKVDGSTDEYPCSEVAESTSVGVQKKPSDMACWYRAPLLVCQKPIFRCHR